VLAAHTGWWKLYQARTCRIFKKRVFRARFQEKRFECERPHTCFTLRGLERDGLVTRTVFPTTPQRVDYELTKLGSTLWKGVEPLGSWTRAHVSDILESRDEFDQKILGSGKHSSSLPLRSRSARAPINNRAYRKEPRRSAK
jgi:hypothetical protein